MTATVHKFEPRSHVTLRAANHPCVYDRTREPASHDLAVYSLSLLQRTLAAYHFTPADAATIAKTVAALADYLTGEAK